MAVSSPDRIGNAPKADRLVVHIDDFAPNIDGRNFGVNFLMRTVYGNSASIYHEALARGKRRVAAMYEPEVNGEAIESIMNMWGISDPKVAGRFYQTQMATANYTIEHVLESTVPGWKQNYSQVNEMTSPSEYPTWSIRRSAKGVEKSFPQMTYEAQRQSLLAIAAGSLHVRTEEDRLGTIRADFQDAILEMYKDPTTASYTLETDHDEETGKVVKVGGYEVGSATRTNKRAREYQVRQVEGVGPVIVGDRQKGHPEMLLKMLVKAKNRMLLGGNGYLNPSDATDAFGMKLVVLESGEYGYEANMQRLQDVVVDQLKNSGTLPIKYMEPDNGKGGHRGTSEHHDFLRLQVHLWGVSVPFEVIIQDAARMRNDEVMHGTHSSNVWREYQYKAFERETGEDLRGRLPDGAEHGIYRLKRYLFALPNLFPIEIYKDRMVEHALDNLRQREEWLREVDRV